ncbi:hypothetical protein Tco_1315592 [Tanacetum coccineum]
MSENEDKYHGTVLDLEARAKKNEDVVRKIGKSLQVRFMLGPKPISFYDSNVKHSLGYENPYTLKKAISQNLKLYDASCFDDSKIHVNIRVNALYKYFVPQKEVLLNKKYFSSSFISSGNSSNAISPSSYSETKPTAAPMPSVNPMILDLNKMENEFKIVRRPSSRDSPFKDSVLSNTKKSSEELKVYVRINKKTDVASKNVVSNKKIVTDVDVQNTLKTKDVLCVSYDKNILIPCHDKCLTNYKLNVHSQVRRALFTTHRTTKSKSLDTTLIVSKTKIAANNHFSTKIKVSSAFKSISAILQKNSLSKYMKNKIRTSRMWQKWLFKLVFMGELIVVVQEDMDCLIAIWIMYKVNSVDGILEIMALALHLFVLCPKPLQQSHGYSTEGVPHMKTL